MAEGENKKQEISEVKQEKKIEETAAKKEEKVEKKEEKKKPEIKKKDKAIVNGKNLPMSTKQSIAICRFIKNKKIEKAIEDLEKVAQKKIAVPMRGELPHRKGMERGRYPVKASKIFIKLLKSLNANSQVNGIENPYVFLAKADIASRPYRRFGSMRFKRTNVYLVAREKINVKKENKEKRK